MEDFEPKIDAHNHQKINRVLENELALHHALGPINYGQEKKKFLLNSSGCPIFKYHTITDKNYKFNLGLLRDLENDLRFEINSHLKQLYLDKIEELSTKNVEFGVVNKALADMKSKFGVYQKKDLEIPKPKKLFNIFRRNK